MSTAREGSFHLPGVPCRGTVFPFRRRMPEACTSANRDAAPRTQVYSNLGWVVALRAAAESASASASVVVGASTAASITPKARSIHSPSAWIRPSAMPAAATMQSASTARSMPSGSATRPAIGPAKSRTKVPSPNSNPMWSGDSPRDSKKRGMNGDLTPKAPYSSP